MLHDPLLTEDLTPTQDRGVLKLYIVDRKQNESQKQERDRVRQRDKQRYKYTEDDVLFMHWQLYDVKSVTNMNVLLSLSEAAADRNNVSVSLSPDSLESLALSPNHLSTTGAVEEGLLPVPLHSTDDFLFQSHVYSILSREKDRETDKDKDRQRGGQRLLRRKKRKRPVIPSWEWITESMKQGEESWFFIRSDYAFGSAGIESVIPPNTDLLGKFRLIYVLNTAEDEEDKEEEVEEEEGEREKEREEEKEIGRETESKIDRNEKDRERKRAELLKWVTSSISMPLQIHPFK